MSPSLPALRRRSLLHAAAAGVTVTFLGGCALPVIPKRPTPDAASAMGWIRFSGGRYTLYLPRAEMGQNILTALKQVACEELGVGWDQVDAILPGSHQVARVRATVGSESIKDFAVPLAQACATLRDALAAGAPPGELKTAERPVAALRSMSTDRRSLRHVGQRVPVEQGRAIVMGEPLFAADIQRPGLVHGRVLRAPVSPELRSRPGALDEPAARAVPGFVAVVRDARLLLGESVGIGIVARTPGALDRIERALAVQWQVDGAFEQADVDDKIDIDRQLEGNPRRANRIHNDPVETRGRWDLDLRLDVPLAAHAPLEPRAAVAEFSASGQLDLWVGTQDVYYQRDVVAKRLGLDEQRVVVHGQRVGGAFGGKTICTVELEAALLALAAQAPVKVQWTRAQEFRQAFHRPPSSHRIRARLKDGRIDQWWHSFVSSHILFTNAVLPPWLQRITDVIGDDGVARGAALPYRVAARRTEFDVVRLPVFTGPWRGLGAGPNGFAIESAVDECALLAGIDPVRFRLDHAADPRLARVLERAAAAAGWVATAPQGAAQGSGYRVGRGVACGIYKAMSYAAVVADVEVDTDGRVKVTRLVCAHDCGRVINPDQVRAQCEGNLVWGVGMALFEHLAVAGSQVAAASFADAPIPRIDDVPPMHIEWVDEGDAPTGAGETAIVAASASVANAIRNATGVRVQRLPVDPASLRRAMRSRHE
jgi:isoquinoline 1-oxidoreductase subunit beta